MRKVWLHRLCKRQGRRLRDTNAYEQTSIILIFVFCFFELKEANKYSVQGSKTEGYNPYAEIEGFLTAVMVMMMTPSLRGRTH